MLIVIGTGCCIIPPLDESSLLCFVKFTRSDIIRTLGPHQSSTCQHELFYPSGKMNYSRCLGTIVSFTFLISNTFRIPWIEEEDWHGLKCLNWADQERRIVGAVKCGEFSEKWQKRPLKALIL